MSSIPSLYVSSQINSQANELITKGIGVYVRDGVELLLINGQQSYSQDSSAINAGSLLQQGLTRLSTYPYDALDLSSNATQNEIRKAYKRMALKYHPDKNPSTTPLFHVIHGAYEKLLDNRENSDNINPSPKPPPPTACSPTKPKQASAPKFTSNQSSENTKPSTSAPKFTSNSSSNNPKTTWEYQSKPNKSTTYRMPEPTTSRNPPRSSPAAESAKYPAPPNSQSQWAHSRPNMAEDNEPRPGQRDFSEYSKERKKEESQANNRRNSRPNPPATNSNPQEKENSQMHDTSERSKRRQKEFDDAKKRISERRAKQQQRQSRDDSEDTTTKNKTKSHTKDAMPQAEKLFQLPIPSGVEATVMNTCHTSVDLTWEKYTTSSSKLKVELSWRTVSKPKHNGWKIGQSDNQDESSDWIISSHLISSHTVRKKNLTPGKKYEFKLRYVLEKDDNYKRGVWCEPVSVTIPEEESSTAKVPDTSTEKIPTQSSTQSHIPTQPSPSHLTYTIEISNIKAKRLHSRSLFSLSNPYIAMTIDQTREKTSVLHGTNEPQWVNETVLFHGIKLSQSLNVEVFDKELILRKCLLGEVTIPLTDLRLNPVIENWIMLTGGSSEDRHGFSEVYLKIEATLEQSEPHSRCDSPLDQDDISLNFQAEQEKETCHLNTGFMKDHHSESAASSAFSAGFFKLIPPLSKSSKTFYYPVYEEKNTLSVIIGYLTPLKYVYVEQRKDNWMFVHCHYGSEDTVNFIKDSNAPLCGWCIRSSWNRELQHDHTYFEKRIETEDEPRADKKKTSNDAAFDHEPDVEAEPMDDYSTHQHKNREYSDEDDEGNEDSPLHPEDEIPVWYEIFDESSGYCYYYNEKSGESEWEPPEWIEEIDIVSGSRYYTKLNMDNGNPIETTWSKPEKFARLIRQTQSQQSRPR